MFIYIHIYISPIYYWLLFILVSSLALHFYIHIYIYYILINVSLIRNRRQELRVADETTIHCAKSLQVATVIMRCNALCYIIIMTESRRIIRDVLPDMTTQTWLWSIVDAYKRTLFHPEVRRWSHTHVHAHTHACMCMCVEFTLHVGLLHVPKCFAVCCSPR